MIDNYDSFTYNLVQYFGELGQDILVHRNDQITLDEIKNRNFLEVPASIFPYGLFRLNSSFQPERWTKTENARLQYFIFICYKAVNSDQAFIESFQP